WNVYASAGTSPSTFYLQNAAPIAIGVGNSYTIDSLVTTGYVVPSAATSPTIPKYSSLPRGGFADALAFFSQWYFSGTQPPIYRDRIYYEYRGCAWGNIQASTTLPALGPPFAWSNKPNGGNAADNVYATIFLTAHDAAQSPLLTITAGTTQIYSGHISAQINSVAAGFGTGSAYQGNVVLTVSGTGVPTTSVTAPQILAARSDAELYCGVSP
ncbi:MAG TPA: hypothetical protein VGS41_08800, partial [Chthonomonadales bacterium]|nr:hypothetical protein [Chthonomonadales bacterium]